MNSPFLSGVVAAWAVAQVAIGAFFLMAYARGRREAEYLLFGLLCFALAVTSAGLSWAYGTRDIGNWTSYSRIAHGGAIAAAGLNLHFVLRYAGIERKAPVIGAYILVLGYEIANALGFWWSPLKPAVLRSRVFGMVIEHTTAQPSLVGISFYVLVGVVLLMSCGLLVQNLRSHRREPLIALIGAVVLALAGVNDILLVTGVLSDTLYLLPHGFLVYAFGVATTLVLRYRATAGALAETDDQPGTGHRGAQAFARRADPGANRAELQAAARGRRRAGGRHRARGPKPARRDRQCRGRPQALGTA